MRDKYFQYTPHITTRKRPRGSRGRRKPEFFSPHAAQQEHVVYQGTSRWGVSTSTLWRAFLCFFSCRNVDKTFNKKKMPSEKITFFKYQFLRYKSPTVPTLCFFRVSVQKWERNYEARVPFLHLRKIVMSVRRPLGGEGIAWVWRQCQPFRNQERDS